jgi:hypothetical protein
LRQTPRPPRPINLVEGEEGDLEKLETPGCETIADLAAFLKVPEAARARRSRLSTATASPGRVLRARRPRDERREGRARLWRLPHDDRRGAQAVWPRQGLHWPHRPA